MPQKTLIVVGNGPLERDFSTTIDAADFVLRFNEPRVSLGMSGTKTDLLMLATSSKQMQDWLSRPDFLNSAIVRNTKEILFAFHPTIIKRFHPRPNFLSKLKGRRADWTKEAIYYFGNADKQIRIMPTQMYFDVCAELEIKPEQMKRVFPSTGFFGIWLMLQTHLAEDWRIKLCGFSWEGWKRHDWTGERDWIETKIKEGRLELLK